jgi:hypothetical protein
MDISNKGEGCSSAVWHRSESSSKASSALVSRV